MRIGAMAAAVGLAMVASASMAGGVQASRVVTAPAPEGVPMSSDYRVTVNGTPVAVYTAPVWYPTYVKPFGGPYAFASFDFAGAARVEIATQRPLDRLQVLPESRGVRPAVRDGKVVLTLRRPCQLSIEPDGKNGPLLLFANPLERDVPRPGAPGVRYFGPGVHRPGRIDLRDNETLYLAAGAVVHGGVVARGRNIRILGRGILDGGVWERFKGPAPHPLQFVECRDALVEGIVLKDSWSWTLVVTNSDGVRIRNVKICSSRCENNDGIDVVNSRNVRVSDCFIRSDDDCIAPKGFGEQMGAEPWPPVEDFIVERTVLWTDRAHIWRLGCESRASAMRRMVFRDIDVIHYTDPTCPAISVQPAEDMLMEDVLFENVRIRHEGQALFLDLNPHPTPWAKKQTPGRIRNVVFRNVSLEGPPGSPPGRILISGAGETHPIENVTFDNVRRHGVKATADAPEVVVQGAVRGVVWK